MFDYDQLTEKLSGRLMEYQYTVEHNIAIPDVCHISYVVNPSPLKVRNLCALLSVPDTIKDNASAKTFFTHIRGNLLNKYGNAFLWKELEICFVIVCGHDLYQMLEDDEGKAVDQAGFSLNAMLGACFIDKATFDHFDHSTWGIYFSGDHYKAVRETVAYWCGDQKEFGSGVV